MRVFILEDDEDRIRRFHQAFIGHDVTLAKDTERALKLFEPPYDWVLLDHDLGGRQWVDSDEEDCGAAFCRRVPVDGLQGARVVVHSFNRDGAIRMIQTLRDKGIESIWQPFGPSVLSIGSGA